MISLRGSSAGVSARLAGGCRLPCLGTHAVRCSSRARAHSAQPCGPVGLPQGRLPTADRPRTQCAPTAATSAYSEAQADSQKAQTRPVFAFLRGLVVPAALLLLANQVLSKQGMLLAGLYSLQIVLPMLLLKKKFNFTAAEALLSSIAIVHGMWALATRFIIPPHYLVPTDLIFVTSAAIPRVIHHWATTLTQGSAGQRFLREACIFLGCCLWWIPVASRINERRAQYYALEASAAWANEENLRLRSQLGSVTATEATAAATAAAANGPLPARSATAEHDEEDVVDEEDASVIEADDVVDDVTSSVAENVSDKEDRQEPPLYVDYEPDYELYLEDALEEGGSDAEEDKADDSDENDSDDDSYEDDSYEDDSYEDDSYEDDEDAEIDDDRAMDKVRELEHQQAVMQAELEGVKDELQVAKSVLLDLEFKMLDPKWVKDKLEELEEAKDELEEAKDELEAAKDELEAAKDELDEAKDELEEAKDDVKRSTRRLEIELEDLRRQLLGCLIQVGDKADENKARLVDMGTQLDNALDLIKKLEESLDVMGEEHGRLSALVSSIVEDQAQLSRPLPETQEGLILSEAQLEHIKGQVLAALQRESSHQAPSVKEKLAVGGKTEENGQEKVTPAAQDVSGSTKETDGASAVELVAAAVAPEAAAGVAGSTDELPVPDAVSLAIVDEADKEGEPAIAVAPTGRLVEEPVPPFKRASSSSKPKERLKYGWDSAAAVVNAAKEVRLPAEQDIRLPAMQEGLPGTEAAATAAELLEKLADRTAAGTEAKEKEAPPAAGEEVPLTSDVPPTVPDNLQTFSGTSRLNRNDMIRDMLTKGMLPNDVSGTATDPLPALLQAEQRAAQEVKAVGEAVAAAEARAAEAAELAASKAQMEGERAAQEAQAAASEAFAAAEARAVEIAGSEAAPGAKVDGESPAEEATETNDEEVVIVEVEDETDVPALVEDAAHEEEACAEPVPATPADKASYKEAATAVEDTDTDSDSFDVPILVQESQDDERREDDDLKSGEYRVANKKVASSGPWGSRGSSFYTPEMEDLRSWIMGTNGDKYWKD